MEFTAGERVRGAFKESTRRCLLDELEFSRAIAEQRSQESASKPALRRQNAERAEALAELIEYGRKQWNLNK